MSEKEARRQKPMNKTVEKSDMKKRIALIEKIMSFNDEQFEEFLSLLKREFGATVTAAEREQ